MHRHTADVPTRSVCFVLFILFLFCSRAPLFLRPHSCNLIITRTLLRGHLLLLRYFDTAIRMVGWNDTLAAGPITSISFTNAVDTGPELRRSSVVALDLDGSDVEIPNYVIGTAHGRIVLVTSDTAVSSAKQILATHASDVRALAAHPTQPLLAIAGYVPPHAATFRHRKLRGIAPS